MTTATDNKIVLLGPMGAGKSSLIHRLRTGEYLSDTESTIGTSYIGHIVHHRGSRVAMGIWDTAGSERFRYFLPIFIRGAKVICLCFERYDTPTVSAFLKYIQDTNDKAKVIVVAMKSDIIGSNSLESLRTFSEYHKFDFYKISSKENTGIRDMFFDIASYLDNEDKLNDRSKSFDSIDLSSSENHHSESCCGF